MTIKFYTSVFAMASSAAVCIVFLLVAATEATLAFQFPISNNRQGFEFATTTSASLLSKKVQRHFKIDGRGAIHERCSRMTLLGGNGGMDAFEAQLLAAHQEAQAQSAQVDIHANEMMNDSRSAVVESRLESSASAAPTVAAGTGRHDVGGLLLQRALQTQLYYLSDLRDEPTYVWLRGFLGHDHLDERKFNQLDGLRCGWRSYLTQLEEAPHFSITVELAPPRLSAQQMRNPYLAAQQSAGRSYEETIMPSKIATTLGAVARSLEGEWEEALDKIAQEDRNRVALHDAPPQLQTAAAAYHAYWTDRQVVAGGEGDDQETPLHSLNVRIVARFCTRVALRRVVEELEEGATDGSGPAAARYMRDFAREWVPRLERGADDDRRRALGIAPPGHWQRLCDGADADDVAEALWQELPEAFAYESDDAMRLYSPGALAARLRRARAEVCGELAEELRAAVLSMSG